MKCWTILALLVAICAVFLGVGHTEETTDDLNEAALEDAYSDTENDVQLADSSVNRENDYAHDENNDDDDGDDDDDDETENAVDSVKETPSNDDDKAEISKRTPWGRRRRYWPRRRRVWPRRRRVWPRRRRVWPRRRRTLGK
ncbi:Hypothetical predicted protein [Paramuricea clavata]|uniref:Uncharacterized protein n=1 Tax=Paramuricea clavata TaxID=317549 RepID=A0A7D9LJF2_PARCT|nr:Hypothetical predicted protein [Paramuricea clavata]